MTQTRLNESQARIRDVVKQRENETTFLTVRECAMFLKLSEISIRRFLTQHKLKRFKVGSRTLIRKADAEALIKEA